MVEVADLCTNNIQHSLLKKTAQLVLLKPHLAELAVSDCSSWKCCGIAVCFKQVISGGLR